MADTLGTSQPKGLDNAYEVCCSICEDDCIHTKGLLYCQKCSKYLCDSCVLTHNKFLKDHSVTVKGECDDCPISNTVDEALELCEEHTTEKLTMFCEYDEKLLCHVCHLRDHKECSDVVLLTDKVKSTTWPLNVAEIKTSIDSFIERLEDIVKIGEQRITSLQTPYEKVLEEIVDVRRLMNDNLDRLQQNTEKQLEELHSTFKNSIENISKNCVKFISMIKEYNIKVKHKNSAERSFIMYRKCLEHSDLAKKNLQKVSKNVAIEFQLNWKLNKFLASCTEFGSSAICEGIYHAELNKVVNFKDKSQYNVRTATDMRDCLITCICESSNGELIIADYNNQCLKLLDRAFHFIDQIQLPTWPRSMCNISTNEMAVTVSNFNSVNEIHFLRVDKGRIVTFNRLQLNNVCCGIAYHQGDLFVTSNDAVCQYTMDGRLVKKLYENKTSKVTVVGVGVSPDGKRIYVTNWKNARLLTLSRDGAITARLCNDAFLTISNLPNIHVAATGQVFIVGKQSVSQVDTDGKTVLNTIQLDRYMSGSVYFNEDTGKMIVGHYDHDKIIEFKTKVS